MHPDTKALLLAAIRAEVQADPTARGYAGQPAAEIAALMNAPVEMAAAPAYRDVLISDVEGYLRARLLIVALRRWVQTAPDGTAKDAAVELLDIIASPRLSVFLTSGESGRNNVLGLFAGLVQAGAGGLTLQHYSEIAAMTVAPLGPPTVAPPRWAHVIDGISGVGNEPGPPNAASEALIAEALNG